MRSTLATLLLGLVALPAAAGPAASPAQPLAIGETFTLESKVLNETRRINVYIPPVWDAPKDMKYPVLYMPDGGIAEDFLHVAGLVQVSVGNGTMRPFMLVGIENTQRRRDLTPPTANPEDKKIAPVVGGSAAFRNFIRDELMPVVRERYKTTDETAIIGESLAGLFIVETFLVEPTLFDTYLAFDPSLWWDSGRLVKETPALLKKHGDLKQKTIFTANSSEERVDRQIAQFAALVKVHAGPNVRVMHKAMPEEKHSTIYHPAATLGLRTVVKWPETGASND